MFTSTIQFRSPTLCKLATITEKVVVKTRAYEWQTINAAVSFRCNIRPWPGVSPRYNKMVDVSVVMN